MSADHTAESTCRGFKDVCRAAGLTVLDTAIAQPVLVVTDNGTEFSGAFQRLCDAAGISRFTSTPNKAAKHEAQPAEGSNRALQRAMRLGLVMARANFEANGHDCRRYWDCRHRAPAAARTTHRSYSTQTQGRRVICAAG